jgi:hypothetical protein
MWMARQAAGRLWLVVSASVIGEAPTMEAMLVRRDAEQRFSSEILFETVVPALAHARRPSAFQF